jgi:hypothetical protein
MRIGVCGAQRTGKTTFVKDFLDVWEMYSTPEKSYSDLVKEKKLDINQMGTEESQRLIRDFICDQVIDIPVGANIIFDRTPLDNLVYTLWLEGKGKVSEEFAKETILVVKNAISFFDIIFFTPISKQSPIPKEDREQRDNDEIYRKEINNIFNSLMAAYYAHSEVFFPIREELGCPGIIEIFGDREQRIQLAKMYLNEDGNLQGEDAANITPGVEY